MLEENIQVRIAKVRENLNISQEDFGTALGVTKSTISLLETQKREPSERLLRDICREFNVNEDWLRTGAGGEENMFLSEDMQYFQNVGKLGREKNEFKKFYHNMMMGLPDEYWDYIYREFKKFEEQKEE
jgi:transcriptional regulator with XRE-family HTH domain